MALKYFAGISSLDDATKRYRQLAKRYHPDVNPSPRAAEKFIAMKTEYDRITAFFETADALGLSGNGDRTEGDDPSPEKPSTGETGKADARPRGRRTPGAPRAGDTVSPPRSTPPPARGRAGSGRAQPGPMGSTAPAGRRNRALERLLDAGTELMAEWLKDLLK